MPDFLLIGSFGVTDPNGILVTAQLLLRWVHLLGGFTWLGLLYFFNLVNTPFLRTLDSETRAKIYPNLMSRAMAWFRWSAVLTVMAGFSYWCLIVAADAHNGRFHGLDASGRNPVIGFLVIWTMAFFLEFGILALPLAFLKNGFVFGTVVAVIVIGSSYLWLMLNAQPWESSRMQSIGIGGGLGWFMMLNVWGVIWRIQKKMIRWSRESSKTGKPLPNQSVPLAKQALLVSRINFFLSFPMLLFMAAASHYPFIVD